MGYLRLSFLEDVADKDFLDGLLLHQVVPQTLGRQSRVVGRPADATTQCVSTAVTCHSAQEEE